MPGSGLEIDMAMQQAPQPVRQSMVSIEKDKMLQRRGSELSPDLHDSRCVVRQRIEATPNRTGPRRIASIAHHMVKVKLWHQIADGGDIHPIGTKQLRQRTGEVGRFPHKLNLVLIRQLINLAKLFPLRNEDEPRIAVLIHQQKPAQRKMA
jgi:hypothetical protein